MMNHLLNPDAQAVLLLCGSLGQPRAREAPLSQEEYNQVAQWLHQASLTPGDLLQSAGIAHVRSAGTAFPFRDRVLRLIERGGALAMAVETWTNNGLWILARSDPDYPRGLRERLGRKAPPILYGVGERTLLAQGGLAIVGSRDADEHDRAFARSIAQVCSSQDIMVISGGARGIDSAASEAALETGGRVLGVLADSLARQAVARKNRAALREGRLTFISPYDPEAGFNTGNAMGRNKLIYALSNLALVVSATLEKGGTWHGATENLHRQWVPLFVYTRESQLPGNRRLTELGGYSVDQQVLDLPVSIDHWLDGRQHARPTALPLQSSETEASEESTTEQQDAAVEQATSQDHPSPAGTPASDAYPSSDVSTQIEAEESSSNEVPPAHKDLFPVVWPHLAALLVTPHTEREVAEVFQLELKQARIWLQRATGQGLLQKLTKPVRYVVASESAQAVLPFRSEDPLL
jgi:predicted Rossmann fold nucleotide-binding protein DprA/Smf involved in DNA uptake